MTMSISSAPARTAWAVSSTLIDVKLWPDGNAVATEAMWIPVPRRGSTQSAIRSGYTHTAATDGMPASPGFGRIALAHSAATLPGVSWPSSVVRSMQRMARSSAQSLDDFLIERLAREAARSSAPTSSTLRTPRMSEPRWVRESAVAIEAIMRRRPGESERDGRGEDLLVEVRRDARVRSRSPVGPDGPRDSTEHADALVVAVLVVKLSAAASLV